MAAEAPRCSADPSPPRAGHLPVVEEVIVPESVRASPAAWQCIGEEVTDLLGYEPAQFFKRRIAYSGILLRVHEMNRASTLSSAVETDPLESFSR
ncbi:MAG: hypothetical protein K8R23_09165 [Chthoniobacter sp.]|nr:hypothetical protein [Chthoniobacter sp.]